MEFAVSKRRLGALIVVAVASLMAFLGVRLLNARVRPAHKLGAAEGRLAACPDRPNCVSTQADSEEQRIDPLVLKGERKTELQRLLSLVSEMPGSRSVSVRDDYLHFEFRSRWLGFVDDVEFFVDPGGQAIQFRSASRVGHSDLGVNRSRMEDIRRRFQQTSTNSQPAAEPPERATQ